MTSAVRFLVLGLFALTSVARGQGLPPGYTLEQSFTAPSLGVPGLIAGMEFDATGSVLYVVADANLATGGIYILPVNRHPVTGRIMSFASPVFLTPAPFGDAGLKVDSNGTLFWTTWNTNTIGQFTASNVTASFPLGTAGVPVSVGGLEFVPPGLPNAGDILVSVYDVGGIWRITMTPNANGTFTPDPGSATPFVTLPPGSTGMRYIPSGPDVGSILYNDFDGNTVNVLKINATTGMPLLDSAGQPVTTPLITSLPWVDGMVFDPVTGDLLISTFEATSVVYHFSGFPPPATALPSIGSIGTGCTGSNGLPAVLTAPLFPVIGNLSFSLDVSDAAPMSTSWLYPSLSISTSPVVVGPGCDIYLDIPGLLFLLNAGLGPFGPEVTDALGAASFAMPLPALPSLAGASLSFQALTFDGGAPGGITLTNALTVLVN